MTHLEPLNETNYYKGMKTSVETVMFYSARNRAKRKGIPFNIERTDIVIPEKCPILGMSLSKSSTGRQMSYSPSLDKIEPSKGYVKGNVQVISHKANTMKNDATKQELIAFANWVSKNVVTENK